MEHNAKLYTQNESKINGRGVWHYLIDAPIGQIHVVEYENQQPRREVLWLSLTNETNFCLKTHRLNGEIVHDFKIVNLATVDRQINKMQTEYLRNGIDLVIMR